MVQHHARHNKTRQQASTSQIQSESGYTGKPFGLSQLAGTKRNLLLPQLMNKGENMKKAVLSIALALAAPFAWAQVSETTTTTTTTDANGTITEYTPGSAIVLKETSGPVRYRFGNTVTYVTRSGKVLDPDVVKTKVKVGVPVRVHYSGTGDHMVVDRVIVDED
jgi:UDP-N-acetylmuramyl tripeptide synthase